MDLPPLKTGQQDRSWKQRREVQRAGELKKKYNKLKYDDAVSVTNDQTSQWKTGSEQLSVNSDLETVTIEKILMRNSLNPKKYRDKI